MEYSEEILQQVTRIAAAGYTPKQTAFRMGIDETLFMRCLADDCDPLAAAYYTGLNTSELTVRESVFNLARSGSSPAQTLALKILDETRKTIRHECANEEAV